MDQLKEINNLNDLYKTTGLSYELITNSERPAIRVPFCKVSLDCLKEIVKTFPNLVALDVNTGQMTDEFMEVIGDNLHELEELDCSANAITNQGIRYLSKVTSLRVLDLSLCDIDDNCIDDLLKLQNLTACHLSGTGISIFNLHRLKGLPHLEQCDLKQASCASSLPLELLVKRDIREIFRYIDNEERSTLPVSTFRVMLLGEPCSGKTNLLGALTHFDNKEKIATLGVNIKKYAPFRSEKYQINRAFNIWDFGGQITQLAIHKLFLSDKCIFAIVVEPRMNDCERDFLRWYRNIRQYIVGKDYGLPVLIVFSKCDNENGGLGNSVDLERTIENNKLKIKEAILSEEKKSDMKRFSTVKNYFDEFFIFVKSSSILKVSDGRKELVEAIDKAINIATGLNRFQLSPQDKELLETIINKSNPSNNIDTIDNNSEIFINGKFITMLAENIIEDYSKDNLKKSLMNISTFGDVYYNKGIEHCSVLINPLKISSIVYDIMSGTDEEFLNISQNKEVPPYIIDVDKMCKYYRLDKEEAAKAILDYLKLNNFIFKKDGEYYVPSRFPMMPNWFPKEKMKNLNGIRHFSIECNVEVESLAYTLLSSFMNAANRNANFDIEDDNVFSDGFACSYNFDGGQQIAVIKENGEPNILDIWMSHSNSEYPKEDIWKIIENKLNEVIGMSDDKNYVIYVHCPCSGSFEKECGRKHNYKRLLDIRNKHRMVMCSESCKYLPVNTFLVDSRIKNDGTEDEPNDIKNFFVITPFTLEEDSNFVERIQGALDEVYNSNEKYKDHFDKPEIAKGIRKGNKTVIDEIIKRIENALIILTIFDKSKPNVFFEMGLSYADENKIHINFTPDDIKDLPFDVSHFEVKHIDYQDLSGFKNELISLLDEAINDKRI